MAHGRASSSYSSSRVKPYRFAFWLDRFISRPLGV